MRDLHREVLKKALAIAAGDESCGFIRFYQSFERQYPNWADFIKHRNQRCGLLPQPVELTARLVLWYAEQSELAYARDMVEGATEEKL